MDRNSFLKFISQLESSGGKNVNHKPIEGGLQEGQTAIGRYGLLPNTVEELVNRAGNEVGPQSKGMMDLMNADNQTQISNRISKSPELEDEMASRLYQHINTKTDDPEKMAYMWNSGHNRNPAAMTPEEVSDDPYVQKFEKTAFKQPEIFKEEMDRRVGAGSDPRMLALEKLMRGL